MKKIFLLSFCFTISLRAFSQSKMPQLEIKHLTGNFYTYISYGMLNGKPFPANSMYLVTNKGIVLFDTPWDKTYYQPLLDSLSLRHHKKVLMCIATHSHEDRTGGLKYYAGKEIKTYTTRLTDSLCIINNMNRAENLLTNDTTFNIDKNTFQTFYPGPGHTLDNIVIWFPKEKILYGGCFIKSASDKDLGYIGEAFIKDWANSIHNLQQKFPNPDYIIVGHKDFTDKNSLNHTLDMVNNYNKEHN